MGVGDGTVRYKAMAASSHRQSILNQLLTKITTGVGLQQKRKSQKT